MRYIQNYYIYVLHSITLWMSDLLSGQLL